MDESGGFFKVYRRRNSRLSDQKPYVNYRGVWLTMLMMTNWKEGFFPTIKVVVATSIEQECGLSINRFAM